MVQIVVDVKGRGKTRRLLEMANEAVKDAKDTVVYLDKNTEHMYGLSNRIRLISVNDYEITNSDGFTGFVSGIISQDHDLETMSLDNFLKLANLESGDITPVVDTLGKIGEKYNVSFMFSVSADAADLPENAKEDAVTALWPAGVERVYGQPFPGCPSLYIGILSAGGGRFGESKRSRQ